VVTGDWRLATGDWCNAEDAMGVCVGGLFLCAAPSQVATASVQSRQLRVFELGSLSKEDRDTLLLRPRIDFSSILSTVRTPVLYWSVLYSTTSSCTVLYCTVLYCAVLTELMYSLDGGGIEQVRGLFDVTAGTAVYCPVATMKFWCCRILCWLLPASPPLSAQVSPIVEDVRTRRDAAVKE